MAKYWNSSFPNSIEPSHDTVKMQTTKQKKGSRTGHHLSKHMSHEGKYRISLTELCQNKWVGVTGKKIYSSEYTLFHRFEHKAVRKLHKFINQIQSKEESLNFTIQMKQIYLLLNQDECLRGKLIISYFFKKQFDSLYIVMLQGEDGMQTKR